ncbi:ABC transporter ATP-binding protein [Neobacillus sp. PS3-40]|uniref:ABC transporter ATP-binding protein n=1 Tax=Neobacillus sp. PS3-40 TaxID=3070679 RepID=UPI0027DF68F5|nr:ABC transporter ATP-binding protein [Neobacillus sp. PS3-40]WML43910.1 ABC transporter ATP-binding protein [Neobacillus sp. PS3-40]
MKNTILSIRNLHKVYKGQEHEVVALNKVSFDLNEGEILAIMGTSGSGKSTLLNIIGALDEPNQGEIVLQNKKQKDIFTEPEATLYRSQNIGFIFQAYHLLKDLTVEENIALPLILKGTKRDEISNKVDNMLRIVGLKEWRNHRPFQLSGGQQQRVAIGRALITSPPIVLADEPTGNLDFNTSTDILKVLKDMKDQFNQSIIIVTHDPYVATFADRVMFFHDGHIVDELICQQDEKDMDRILSKFRKIMEYSK